MTFLLRPFFALRYCGGEGGWKFCAGFVLVFGIVGTVITTFAATTKDTSYKPYQERVVAAYATDGPHFYFKTDSGYRSESSSPTYVGDTVTVWCNNEWCADSPDRLFNTSLIKLVGSTAAGLGFLVWLMLYMGFQAREIDSRVKAWRYKRQRGTAYAG